MHPITVFVGYDPREAVAYHVFCQSVIEKSSIPVKFVPLALNHLKDYNETHEDGSNAFIYSRFLVPHLMDYKGHALFFDGDMIMNGDIAELWNLRDHTKAVQVVKHDYQTKYPVKYLGAKNEDYPRKNWSSVILWNCANFLHRKLTPEFVSCAKGSYLHRFSWIPDERIGELPKEWNHLTMEYEPNPNAKLYHQTVGSPCFEDYRQQESAKEWFDTLARAMQPVDNFVNQINRTDNNGLETR